MIDTRAGAEPAAFSRTAAELAAAGPAGIPAELTTSGFFTTCRATCPGLTLPPLSPLALTGYAAFGLLAMFPTILQTEVDLRWRFLQSKL